MHLRESGPPPKPTNWKKLSLTEREKLDELRTDHHRTFGPVLTPRLKRLNSDLCKLAFTNLKPISGARPGAVIDGLSNLGKTTMLAYFGFEYERLLREQHGDRMRARYDDEWHPVIYVTLNAQASVKGLNESLIEFYAGMTDEAATYRLTNQVVRHVQRCATTLILIDDVHYLNLRYRGAREVINHLKQLANLTSATFVFAGVGLSETKLLTEGQPDDKVQYGQMRGRFTWFPVEAFDAKTGEGKSEWLRLVKAFEEELVLYRSYEGMLTNMAPYLHQRTKGVVGSLSNLIRQGADEAMQEGGERITKKLLNQIKIDVASESL